MIRWRMRWPIAVPGPVCAGLVASLARPGGLAAEYAAKTLGAPTRASCAKALGLTNPQSLLLRADEVIQ